MNPLLVPGLIALGGGSLLYFGRSPQAPNAAQLADWNVFFAPTTVPTETPAGPVWDLSKIVLGPARIIMLHVPGHPLPPVTQPNSPLISQEQLGGSDLAIGVLTAANNRVPIGNLVWVNSDKSYGIVQLPQEIVTLMPSLPSQVWARLLPPNA